MWNPRAEWSLWHVCQQLWNSLLIRNCKWGKYFLVCVGTANTWELLFALASPALLLVVSRSKLLLKYSQHGMVGHCWTEILVSSQWGLGFAAAYWVPLYHLMTSGLAKLRFFFGSDHCCFALPWNPLTLFLSKWGRKTPVSKHCFKGCRIWGFLFPHPPWVMSMFGGLKADTHSSCWQALWKFWVQDFPVGRDCGINHWKTSTCTIWLL